MKDCIVGASGKLRLYMVQHVLDRGYEVTGVCREQSVAKLDVFARRVLVIPGRQTTARSYVPANSKKARARAFGCGADL